MTRVPRLRVAAMAASLVVAVAIGSSARAALGPPERSAAERPPAGVHGHTIGHTHPHTAGSDVDPLANADLDVLQGDEAVEQLVESDILEEVAADAGLAPEELVEEFLADPSLFLGDDGVVGYADAFPLDGAATASEALTAVPRGVDVNALSSRGGAPRTLYLDFDGHTTNDAAWASVGARLPINSDAFVASDEVIYEIWLRVRENFAPFNINVTTIDPGPSSINVGQRVVISPTNWVGPGVLGVALLNSFGSGVDRPAFVFTAGASIKTIAEAVTHEAGHTFGLRHDGIRARCGAPAREYYDGHGVWAPIMGRSISALRPVTQWSRGEYRLANNGEDDVTRIRSFTGPAPDDHGNTADDATPVTLGGTATGFIGINDVDVFAVDLSAGSPLGVELRPPAGTSSWANLYASVTVRNQAGGVVATGLPTAPPTWRAPVSIASLPAGRYTIEVRPTAHLHPFTGFTTYGSMGAYGLTVTAGAVAPAPSPPPPPPVPPVSTGDCFAPVAPARLLDTRNGLGGTRVAGGRQVVVQVTGRGDVPVGATAGVVTVAAVNPSGPGFLTVHPCSPTVPDTSTLNYVGGQTVANTTIAALSGSGQLCVWTFADTDILVDVTGWIGPTGSARLTPIGPVRVVDTRSGVGGVRLGPGATLSVDLSASVPAGTTAVAVNATAVGASQPAFLTVFPCGPRPDTSTVNYVAGEARPNNVMVGLSSGRICVYSFAATNVLIDLVGAFGPTGLAYAPTAPTRVLDTRQFRPPLSPGEAIAYNVSAPALGGVVPGAAFVNLTGVNHTAPGFVTSYDCRTLRDTSTLNLQVGQGTANGAIVPLDGLLSCAWTFAGGHLIADVNGWWVP